jgi:hypothetical protein
MSIPFMTPSRMANRVSKEGFSFCPQPEEGSFCGPGGGSAAIIIAHGMMSSSNKFVGCNIRVRVYDVDGFAIPDLIITNPRFYGSETNFYFIYAN